MESRPTRILGLKKYVRTKKHLATGLLEHKIIEQILPRSNIGNEQSQNRHLCPRRNQTQKRWNNEIQLYINL